MPDQLFTWPLAALLFSVLLGLFAPPPRRRVRSGLVDAFGVSASILIAGGMLSMPISLDWGILIASAGMCALFVVVWLSAPPRRQRDDRPDDQGDDGWGWSPSDPPPGPPPPQPVDWAEFQRQLEEWAAQGVPSGAGSR